MKTELEKYTKEELIALVKSQEKAVSILEKKSKSLEKEANGFHQKNKSLEGEIVYLKYKMEQLLRELYGQKRERFENRDNNQLSLPFEAESEEQQKIDEQATQENNLSTQKAEEKPSRANAAPGSSAG